MEVDNECSKLLTINTHREIFKFNRLTLGIKVTPDIFQQIVDKIVNGLDFAVAYLEDILLKSETPEEHKRFS